MTVYFGDEVSDALLQYIEGSRSKIIPREGHENALFYSMQRKRIGVQAVQNLVKKYARQVTPLKKITPHKCGVLMELLFTRRQMIFIWLRKFWAITM